MSTTVDNRVVEMQFNNAQFEQGVAQSMSTLDKLKAALKFDKSSDGLDNLSKSLQHLPTNGLENSIDLIASRFTTMGIIGTRVLQNLTDSAMRFGKKLIGSVITPITQGGKQRAMDLAQAKFTMEGLLGDAQKAADVVEVASESVSGTAYGLDEAASIASQFTSSGITDLNKLQNALSAVSGVAAMTGANYAEIGDIFVSVAGNGRVMASDLNRLSVRGMNGAAALGKALGKSETEIRDMVHKGKIDFQTFADAMYNSFGAQAKKSNDTFTGALANMKAALKRIGADFYDFLLIDARDVFNAIRPKINEVHDQLSGFIEFTKKAARGATDAIVKLIGAIDVSWISGAAEKVTDIFSGVFNGIKHTFGDNYVTKDMWKQFKEGSGDVSLFRKELKKTAREAGIDIDAMVEKSGSFSNTLKEGWLTKDILNKTIGRMKKMVKEGKLTAKEVDKISNKVINGDYANGEERIKKLTKAGYDYGTIQNVVNKNLGSSVRHVEKLSDAYLKNKGYTEKEIKLLRDLAKEAKKTGTPLNDLMDSLNRKTTGQMLLETVGNVFKGLKKTVSAVAKAFSKVFAGKSKNNIKSFVTQIWELSKGLDLSKDKTDKLTAVFTVFFQVIKTAFNIIGFVAGFVWKLAVNVGLLIVKLLDAVDVGTILEFVFTGVLKVFQLLEKVFGFFRDVAISVGKALTKFVKGVIDFFGQVKQLKGVQRLTSVLKDMGKAIADFAYDKFKNIIDFFKNLFHVGDSSKPVDYSFLLSGIDFAANKLADFLEWIQTIPGKISDVFGSITSKFDTSGIDSYTSKVSGIPESFENARDKIVDVLSKLVETVKEKLANLTPGNVLKYLSLGTLGLFVFGVIKLIGKIRSILGSVDDIKFAFVDAIESISKVFDAQAKDVSAGAFKKMAEGVAILAGSILVLSTIDPETLGNVVANIAILVVIIGLIKKLNAKASDAGKGIDDLKKYVVDQFTGILSGFTEKLGKAADKAALAALLVSVGVVIGLINLIIIRIAKMNPAQYFTGMAGVIGIMVLLGVFLKVVGKLVKGSSAASLAAAAGVLTSFGVVATILTVVVAILGALPIDVLTKGILGLVGFVLGLSILIQVAGSVQSPTGLISAAFGVLLFASAIALLTPVLLLLGVAAGPALKGAGIIVILATTLGLLAAAMNKFGSFEAAAGIMTVVTALTLLGAAALVIGANFDAAVKGLIVFTAALIALVLAGIAAEALQAGFMTLAAVLVSFGVAAAGIGIAAFGIGTGLFFAALGVEALGRGLPALADGIVKFFKIIIDNAPLIIAGVTVIILGVAAAIVSGSAAIGAAVVAVLVGIIYTLIQYAPMIWEGIKSIGSWLVNNLPEIFMDLLNGIISGVGYIISHLPDILLGLGKAILKLLANIGAWILDGIAGWLDWIPGVGDSIHGVADDMRNAFTEEKGKETTKGFGEGAKGQVEDELADFPFDMNDLGTAAGGNLKTGLTDATSELPEEMKNIGLESGGNLTDGTLANLDMDQIKEKYQSGELTIPTNNAKASSEKIKKDTDISSDVKSNVDKTNEEVKKLGNVEIDTSKIKDGANKIVKGVDISSKIDSKVKKANESISKLGQTEDTGVGNKVSKLAEGVAKSVNVSSSYKKSGSSSGSAYVSSVAASLIKGSGPIKRASEKLAASGASGFRSKRESFKSAGTHCMSGVVEGLRSKMDAIKQNAINAANTWNSTYKSHQKISSPSKVTYKFGAWTLMGLVNGMKSMMSNVKSAARNTADTVQDSLSVPITAINDLFNTDLSLTPVIRPVIDDRNVANGVNRLDSMLGDRSLTIGGGIDVAGALAASRIQNGNSNADVVSAIAKLRGDIGKIQGNTYNVNGVTYDDGSNIHDAIGTLIRATVVEGRA